MIVPTSDLSKDVQRMIENERIARLVSSNKPEDRDYLIEIGAKSGLRTNYDIFGEMYREHGFLTALVNDLATTWRHLTSSAWQLSPHPTRRFVVCDREYSDREKIRLLPWIGCFALDSPYTFNRLEAQCINRKNPSY